MCTRSHKNGNGILTYYRGGLLVGVGENVWPGASLACATLRQATRGEIGLGSAGYAGRNFGLVMALSSPVGYGALPGSHLVFARVWGWCSISFFELARGGGVFMPS